MSHNLNISLVDAINISIERVRKNFDNNWLITGDSTENDGALLSEEELQGDRYRRVVEPYSHNYLELCFCVKGQCGLQLEDNFYKVDEGNAGLILPGVLHDELSMEDYDYLVIWIAFTFDKVRVHLSGKSTLKNFFTLDGYSIKPDYEYNLLFNNIIKESDNNNIFGLIMIKTYILQVLTMILRRINETKVEKSSNELWKDSVVEEVQKYIEKNCSKHLRLEDISKEICISSNYLNTIFKSITKKTIMQYLEDWRIDRAKYLLKESDDSIKNISNQLGYYDQYHFSKSFKKATSYSPSQFRKM